MASTSAPRSSSQPDNVGMPLARGRIQGCAAIVGSHRRSGPPQEVGGRHPDAHWSERVDEGCVPLFPARVHVDSLSKQSLHAAEVSPAGYSEHQFVMCASHENPAPASAALQESRLRPRPNWKR